MPSFIDKKSDTTAVEVVDQAHPPVIRTVMLAATTGYPAGTVVGVDVNGKYAPSSVDIDATAVITMDVPAGRDIANVIVHGLVNRDVITPNDDATIAQLAISTVWA